MASVHKGIIYSCNECNKRATWKESCRQHVVLVQVGVDTLVLNVTRKQHDRKVFNNMWHLFMKVVVLFSLTLVKTIFMLLNMFVFTAQCYKFISFSFEGHGKMEMYNHFLWSCFVYKHTELVGKNYNRRVNKSNFY